MPKRKTKKRGKPASPKGKLPARMKRKAPARGRVEPGHKKPRRKKWWKDPLAHYVASDVAWLGLELVNPDGSKRKTKRRTKRKLPTKLPPGTKITRVPPGRAKGAELPHEYMHTTEPHPVVDPAAFELYWGFRQPQFDNPIVSKRELRRRVKGLVEAAEVRWKEAQMSTGKRRKEKLRDAYAQAMTARFIAVELLRDDELADRVNWMLPKEIWAVNPMPGVPGGGITECIEEMSTRPDVDDPGALCAWIAQQRGEFGWRSLPRRPQKKKSKERRKVLGSIMRKALR